MDKFLKFLTLAVLCALPVFVVFGPVLAVMFPMIWFFFNPLSGFLVFMLCGLAATWAYQFFLAGLKSEVELIRQVGPEHALWTVSQDLTAGGFLPWQRFTWQHVIMPGSNVSADFWRGLLGPFLPASSIEELFAEETFGASSILYSNFILMMDACFVPDVALSMGFVIAGFACVSAVKHAGKSMMRFSYYFILVCLVAIHIPAKYYGTFFRQLLEGLVLVLSERSLFVEWLSWRVTHIVVLFTSQAEAINVGWQLKAKKQLDAGGVKFIAQFRHFVMSAVKFVDDVSLPEFVRRGFRKTDYTLQGIKDSNALMADIGWPINVEVTDEHVDVPGLASFREWVIGGSDFRQGIHNLKTWVDDDLEGLRLRGLEYRRSEEYASPENELRATARYFTSPNYNYPDIALDDVWYLVGDIFRHSRLTSFNTVIKLWEKKYGLGAFMRDPKSLFPKKLSRKDFISSVGYSRFKEIWARTFYYATQLTPVAAVSVKGEALPPRKWMQDKVRTVIGSPIGHYIMSTVFNMGPNHRFAWESTPIKVGMPLNGHWMSWVFSRHSRCQIHVEGDFSDFDSTVTKPIQDVVKAIRKRGFDMHKDRDRIGELIDVTYDQIQRQVLNTTSNGNLYDKGSGMTTGHSSTSMDNSVALVTYYLMAWRELTGLSAKEFVAFNELSCYGDDHLLSMLQTRPQAWTPSNIRRVMAKWGVTNNLETKRLEDCEFLSKRTRKATSADNEHLRLHGLPPVSHIVWHNKQKLIGKLTAPLKQFNATYRVKRFISYLELTAHHPDVYESVVRVLNSSNNLRTIIAKSKMKVPTYKQVLTSWYSEQHHQPVNPDMDDDVVNTGKMVIYGHITPIDSLLGFISLLPDFLSPSVFNFGYSRALQNRLHRFLQWSFDFICDANYAWNPAHARRLLQQTPYGFLRADDFVRGQSGANRTEMLLRHWCVLAYLRFRPSMKGFGMLGLVTRKIANFQFALNGKLLSDGNEAKFDIDLMLLVAALSFLSFPDMLGALTGIQLPDLNALVDGLWHFAMVSIWSTVPANYKEVLAAFESANRQQVPCVLSAPTGTGKSTALVAFLSQRLGHTFHKLVVIVPRHVLAKGLTNYMKADFNLNCTAGTQGEIYEENAKVVFCTHQFLYSKSDLLSPDNVFVVDESHLQEPLITATKRLLRMARLRHLLVSATPTPEDIASGVHVALETPNIFAVVREDVKWDDAGGNPRNFYNKYKSDVLSRVSSLPGNCKALIFLRTPEDCEEMAQRCTVPSQCLSSKHNLVGMDKCRAIFATSVADVGITIPDLTHVFTLEMEWIGGPEGHWAKPYPGLVKQRCGRVGRTSNGFALVYSDKSLDLAPERIDFFSAKTFSSLLATGFPAEVLHRFASAPFFSVLGVDDSSLTEEQALKIVRAAGVVIRNAQPLIAEKQHQSVQADYDFGPGGTIIHEGLGNIASDVADFEGFDSLLGPLKDLASYIAGQSKTTPSMENFSGFTFNMKHLLENLTSREDDPSFPFMGKKPLAYDPSFVWEAPKILSILDAIASL